MATPNPDELNQKIRQIQERINKLLGDEKIYYQENLDNLKAQNAELEKFELLFKDVVNAANELNAELTDTALYFRRSVNELSKQNTELANAKNALKSISKIASEIVYENSQNNLIEEEILDKLEKKAKIQFQSLKIAIQSGQIQEEGELNVLKDTLKEQENFFDSLTKIRKKQQEIKSDAGVRIFTGLGDISSTLPGLNKFTSAFKDASKASQEQAIYNQKIFGNVKGLTAEQIKSLETGKGLSKELSTQLGLIDKNGKALTGSAAAAKAQAMGITQAAQQAITPLQAGIRSLGPALAKALGPLALLYELVDAFLKSDKIVGDMAKGLNMSYNEASLMKQELTSAANSSGSIFVTSKGMAESLMAINKTLGTNIMLNKEDLVTFTKLREIAGLTNEELMGIQSLTLTNGKSLKQNTGEIMAQAKISSLRNGIVLNEKEILKEIGKVSAATTLTLGKNPKALADAVAQAKSLGLEMAQLEKIADGLLNFEQSIGSELEAELLTGRQLNLEQARYYALMGKTGDLAKELSTQLGSAEEFGKMNVIQQEALAKSFGMSREELAKSLFIQDQLKGATGEEAKVRERRLNALIAEKGLGEAQRLLEEEGLENLEKQASSQERFTAAVEKMKELFVSIVEPLMPLIDVFATILGIVGQIMKLLDPILQFTSTGFSFIGDLLNANTYKTGEFKNTKASVMRTEDSFQKNWAQPLGSDSLGFNIYNRQVKPTGDMMYTPSGKTIVSTKEGGLFELSNNDDILAAPDLSKLISQNTSITPKISNSSLNNPQPPIDISVLSGKMDMLLQTNKEANNLLSQLVKKDTSVYMDGSKVGKRVAIAESQLG